MDQFHIGLHRVLLLEGHVEGARGPNRRTSDPAEIGADGQKSRDRAERKMSERAESPGLAQLVAWFVGTDSFAGGWGSSAMASRARIHAPRSGNSHALVPDQRCLCVVGSRVYSAARTTPATETQPAFDAPDDAPPPRKPRTCARPL